jgi:hypothetical protein
MRAHVAVEPVPEWVQSPFALQPRELRIAERLGVRSGERLNVTRLIGASVILGWLMLLLLCLAAGTAYGDRVTVPFLRDFFAYGRYLVAAPLLLLMNVLVERRTARALSYLHDSGLVAEVEEAVRGIVLAAARAWQSRLLRWILIALTAANVGLGWLYMRVAETSSWMFTGEPGAGHLSWAGTWNLLVGGAIVKFLGLMALAKMLIWLWVLRRLSKLPLRINPLHPDRCCGLRLLGQTQLAFAPLISALSVQLGCAIAVGVRYHGMSLAGFRWIAAVFIVLAVVVLLGPLAVFARRSLHAIEEAEKSFGAWANLAGRYTAEERVAPRGDPADQLSQPEISAFTDASSTFASLLESKIVPIDRRLLIAVLAAATVPMILPLLVLLPLRSIMADLVKILI